ncbi:hypothetical protein [Sphingobacterium sp.]|uniref:hypothetical protein n=1 Tax=Sphingobacterium sp. TaxID=341027 RepID=UPI00289F23C0|nr:hypothetical protein [Sphingobacterium sp.]
MKSNTLYTDSQSFFSWWLYLILLTVSVASFSVHRHDLLRLDFVPLFQLPGFWVNLILWGLFAVLSLKTMIHEEGVEVHFFLSTSIEKECSGPIYSLLRCGNIIR